MGDNSWVRRALPSAVTLSGMSCALIAVHFSFVGSYGPAISLIGAAAVLDGLDGRLARLLHATSKLGGDLDSLVDGIAFGVTPVLVLSLWRFKHYPAGWIAVSAFAACMLLRLARYNTLRSDPARASLLKDFFLGVPAPVGGLLVLAPLAFSLELGAGWWDNPLAVTIWTLAIAVLLVAPIPTWSAKSIRISSNAVVALLAGLATVIALTILVPIALMVLVAALYLAHLPYAAHRYRGRLHHPDESIRALLSEQHTPAVATRDPAGVPIADELEA